MSENKGTPKPKPENEQLAKLLSAQQEAFGDTDKEFVARWTSAENVWRSFIDWRQGKRVPSPATRSDIEKAIGWKPGSIGRLLSGEGVFLSLADVQDLPAEERPVKRASELSDDELLSEVTRRFKNYADTARIAVFPADIKTQKRSNVTELRPLSEPSRIDEGSQRFAARQDGEYEDGND